MKSGHIKLADFGTALRGLSEEALKNVFVGTAEYVSPEVLNEDFAISKSCDLWALGCIVFQMLTGRSPFRADTEYLVFQAINNYLDGTAPLEYPSTISENAKSLIESLLRKEPPSRLGAGVAGSGNSYADLKSHPFFDGIVWNDINRATPPYIPDPSNLPDPNEMSDGAFDDWMMEGEATPIDPYDLLPYASTPSMSAGPSKWDALLMPDETVVYSGAVWKRKVCLISIILLGCIYLNYYLFIYFFFFVGLVFKETNSYFDNSSSSTLRGS